MSVPKSFRSFWVLLCALGILCTHAGYGADLTPAEIRGDNQHASVSVLQNRYFLKSWRPEIGFLAGSFLNESYTDTNLTGVRAALFTNEWFGFEYQSIRTTIADSDDRKALNKLVYKRVSDDKLVSPDPDINPVHGISELTAVMAPFYGKLNLMDMLIVYSDLYLTAGAAQLDSKQGKLTAMVFGAGQRFYIGQSTSLRIDFRDRTYKEQRAGQPTRKNSYAFDVGMSYFFL